VIPAYDEEKLIRGCLESLKKQDYTGDFEIIVVDNGSKDNTAQIAQDMGVKVVFCTHKGVSYARQAGSMEAQGAIIVQADADTVYPHWWLTRIQKQFDIHPEAVAVAGTFIYQNPPWWAGVEFFLRGFFGFLSALVLGRPYVISGANFAFYKRALIQIGGYDHNSYSSDQFNISTRLSGVGKVIYDRKSYGATSERSVAKPVYAIIMAFIRHLYNFGKHILRTPGTGIKKRSKKISSISTGTYIKIAIPIFLIGVLCYGYFGPASQVFGKVDYRSATSEKVIALTFDDGPIQRLEAEGYTFVTVPELLNVPAYDKVAE
jgi:glycosyltransferase involved in cell wall biosynthesis